MRRLFLDHLRPLLAPHRSTATLLVACGFLASITEGVGISLFIPLFNAIDPDLAAVDSESGILASITEIFSTVPVDIRVVTVAGIIFAAILGKAVLSYATTYLSTRLAAESSRDLRSSVVDVVLDGNPSALSRLGHGRVMNVLSGESWKTGDALALAMLTVVSALQAAVYLVVLILVSWQMTLAAAVLLGVIALVVRRLTRRVRKLSRKITRANADVSRQAIDMVGGAEVIRGFGTEERERREFEASSRQLTKDSIRSWGLVGVITPLYEIVAAAVIVGILVGGSITGPGLAYQLVFVVVLFRLVPVVRRLEKDRAELLAAEGSIRETCAVIAAADEVDIQSGSKPFEGISEKIELVAANYQYAPDASLALDSVTLTVPARGITALVGPSGAGKSTLGRIILRLMDPTSGQVLVDGTPMTGLDLSSWRTRVAVVPQRSFLFNATVRDNIAYGSPDASDEDIVAAARAAGAHDFISALADGYEARLGEEGVELSGGEAQRICLARAIIRKPELLLLDEATNALDAVSELHVRRALNDLRNDCSVVVIAHRLESVKHADQIVVLEEGRIVETGEFEPLLNSGGKFAAMYRSRNDSI